MVMIPTLLLKPFSARRKQINKRWLGICFRYSNSCLVLKPWLIKLILTCLKSEWWSFDYPRMAFGLWMRIFRCRWWSNGWPVYDNIRSISISNRYQEKWGECFLDWWTNWVEMGLKFLKLLGNAIDWMTTWRLVILYNPLPVPAPQI